MVENGCYEAKFATDEEKPTTDEEKLTTGVPSTPLIFRGYGHHRSIRFKLSTITRPPTTASFSSRAETPRHVTYFGGARDGEKEMLRKKYHVVRKKNHVVRKLFYVASILGGAAGRKNRPPWKLSSTLWTLSSTAWEVSSTAGTLSPTASLQCVTEHPHFWGDAQTSLPDTDNPAARPLRTVPRAPVHVNEPTRGKMDVAGGFVGCVGMFLAGGGGLCRWLRGWDEAQSATCSSLCACRKASIMVMPFSVAQPRR